jgi:hypothetical protein
VLRSLTGPLFYRQRLESWLSFNTHHSLGAQEVAVRQSSIFACKSNLWLRWQRQALWASCMRLAPSAMCSKSSCVVRYPTTLHHTGISEPLCWFRGTLPAVYPQLWLMPSIANCHKYGATLGTWSFHIFLPLPRTSICNKTPWASLIFDHLSGHYNLTGPKVDLAVFMKSRRVFQTLDHELGSLIRPATIAFRDFDPTT